MKLEREKLVEVMAGAIEETGNAAIEGEGLGCASAALDALIEYLPKQGQNHPKFSFQDDLETCRIYQQLKEMKR